MTTLLLILSAVFLLYLSFYALIFIALSLAAFLIKPSVPLVAPASYAPEPVTVLIPAYNEGSGLIDAVVAVKEQDYAAKITINILVKDKDDNSLPELLKFYGSPADLSSLNIGCSLILSDSSHSQINLTITGQQTKKDKLNLALAAVGTPYVAILDADHRPTSNWLSSSLDLFTDGAIASVQTRRRPLGLKHLAQIWDSVQNHSGNELLNNFLSALKRGVFFTGTAAVFRTEIIRRFGLSDGITEDTYLSYDLWCNGYKTIYNNRAISYEEVSPSFRDYVARRRRWSAGHNQTFFSHLGKIIKAPITAADKLVLFFHGEFYLVPLAVWLLLDIYGLYFWGQLGFNFKVGVLLSALFFGFLLASAFRQVGRRFGGDWLIAALWLFPQFAVWAVFVYRLMGAENYYYILIFPYARDWIFWHAALFLAPLLIVLASFYFFKDSRQLRNLWVIPTYIFSLFLDIYAGLLGFWDFIWGRAYWSKITRRNSYSAELLPDELKANLITGRALKRTGWFLPLLIVSSFLFLIMINDLLAVNNCGEIKYFLWRPIIFKAQSPLDWKIKLTSSLAPEGDRIKIQAASNLAGQADNYVLKYSVDGQPVGEKEISAGETGYFGLDYPLGWQKHSITVDLYSRNAAAVFCRRELSFATAFKELRGKDLYINNEKFLIKGLIPSFNNNQTDLSLAAGLAQIKAIGANVVRFYHRGNSDLLKLAADNDLLVIDQPDQSTWNELDLKSHSQVKDYTDRYENLVKEHQGEPYLLWDGFGNEWELGDQADPAQSINLTNQILLDLTQAAAAPITSYSTYYTFLKYPVDISGINMLDTGRTYWGKALAIIKGTGKPFYASEFGGFVAFWEKTDPELRINRLLSQWPLLIKAGAIGANFYESHDNWAQPVVMGYNDPFKNDQPDDARGFWDNQNKPKPELKVLEKIFSDFSVETSEAVISDPNAPISLKIKNIREYGLKKVVLAWNGGKETLGDFKPGETKEIKIILDSTALSQRDLALRFSYTSHAGLSGESQADLILPIVRMTPVILNDDFEAGGQGEDYISGRLISSSSLSVILPAAWQRFTLNGQNYEKTASRLELPLVNPYHPLDDLEFSRDGKSWTKVNDDFAPGGGDYFFRFRWPKIAATKQSLILAGLGASQVEFITAGASYSIPTHSYRENAIGIDQLNNPQPGDLIVFKISRDETLYIDKASAARGLKADFDLASDIKVDFELPRLFAPLTIDLQKAP